MSQKIDKYQELKASLETLPHISPAQVEMWTDMQRTIDSTRDFRITKFEEQGRNIVVSRRAILEEERRRQRDELKASLEEGMVVPGTITNIRDFGAFVDIGGLEGLLPISEISYSRVENIR